MHRIYLARAAIVRGIGSMLLGTVADAARSAGADGLWLSLATRTGTDRDPPATRLFDRGRATFRVGDEPLMDWITQRRFEALAP